MNRILDCAGKPLDLSRPQVMGILNVTPDSFSDGGRFTDVNAAVERACRMAEEGAGLIDVGGESTRPGAEAVPAQQELERVVPVIEALRDRLAVPVSVDTSKPQVMRAAVAAGAGMINDVRALRDEGALEIAAALGVPVCLMHMQGRPRDMQRAPRYEDVVREVRMFLESRVDACVQAGLARERLLIDPGFGFGKTLAHNLALMVRLDALTELQLPVLVGVSRKSMVGAVLEAPLEGRLYGSLALETIAVWQGASVVRTHEVRAAVEALSMVHALREAAGAPPGDARL